MGNQRKTKAVLRREYGVDTWEEKERELRVVSVTECTTCMCENLKEQISIKENRWGLYRAISNLINGL